MPPQPKHHQWFAEEVHPHEPALRAHLRGHFPTLRDIDDLVQDSHARLFRARHAGKVTDARPYLFVTARNAAVDFFRRRRVVRIEGIADLSRLSVVEERPDAAEAATDDQELELLADAIQALPERCRLVLTLRKLHGLSYYEIAAQLGISENTVDAQVRLGVLRCRHYLPARGLTKTSRA